MTLDRPTNMRRVVVLWLVVLMSACTQVPAATTTAYETTSTFVAESSTTSGPASSVEGGGLAAVGEGSWLVDDVVFDGEVAALEGLGVFTLRRSAPGQLAGVWLCNEWFADVAATGSGLSVAEVGMTAMDCGQQAATVEDRWVRALTAVTEVSMVGDRLVLSGDGVRLEFREGEEWAGREVGYTGAVVMFAGELVVEAEPNAQRPQVELAGLPTVGELIWLLADGERCRSVGRDEFVAAISVDDLVTMYPTAGGETSTGDSLPLWLEGDWTIHNGCSEAAVAAATRNHE